MKYKTEMDFLQEMLTTYPPARILTAANMVMAIQAAKSAYNNYLQEKIDDRLNNLGEDN